MLSPEQWLRINQVHELVKQEGDANCEAAFDDLIAEVQDLQMRNGLLKAAAMLSDLAKEMK